MATPTLNGLHGAPITPATSNSLMPQQIHAPLGKPDLQATQAPFAPVSFFLSALFCCLGFIAHLSFEKQ